MGVLDDEQKPCPCYKENQEFYKLLELKDNNFVLYIHRTHSGDSTQFGVVGSAANISRDVFILHNKNEENLETSKLCSELENNDISCPRCKKTFKLARELMKEFTSIDGKIVMGICEHCRKKIQGSKRPFCTCDKVVKKFLSINGDQKDDIKKHVKIWLSKMGHRLKDGIPFIKPKPIKTRAYSDLQINQDRKSSASRHGPEYEQMFFTETHKSDINIKTEMKVTDFTEVNLKRAVETSFTLTPHENIKISAKITSTSSVVSDKTIVGAYVGVQELPKTSLKERKQEEIFKDKSSMDALKRRHDLSLRQMMRPEKEFGVPYSVSKRPDVYEIPKIAPWEQKLQRSVDKLSQKTKKVDPPKSLRWHKKTPEPKESVVPVFKPQFSFFFPKKTSKLEKQVTPKMSSSQYLIKHTREKVRLQKEKEKQTKEKKRQQKFELDQKKKFAREEKKLLVEDNKRRIEHSKTDIKSMLVGIGEKPDKTKRNKSEEGLQREGENFAEQHGVITKESNVSKKHTKSEPEHKIDVAMGKAKQSTLSKLEQTEKNGEAHEDLKGTSLKPELEDKNEIFQKVKKDSKSKLGQAEKTDKVLQKDIKVLTRDKDDKITAKSKSDLKNKHELKDKDEVTEKQSKQTDKISPSEEAIKESKRKYKDVENEKKITMAKDTDEKLQKQKEEDESIKEKMKQIEQLRKEKEALKKQAEKDKQLKEKDVLKNMNKKEKPIKKSQDSSNKVIEPTSKVEKSVNKEKQGTEEGGKEISEKTSKSSEFLKLRAEYLKKKEVTQKKTQLENGGKQVNKPKNVADRQAIPKVLKQSDIKMTKSEDDLILKLVRIKQASEMKPWDIDAKTIKEHRCNHGVRQSSLCPLCLNSELEIDVLSLDTKRNLPEEKITDIIIGEKIFKIKRRHMKTKEPDVIPKLYQKIFLNLPHKEIIPQEAEPVSNQTKDTKKIEMEPGKGILRYALSDRTFIEKGWTMLPTEKVVRKMNVYRMRPAHPEFDWFEHNKNKRLMTYDTGERLAEFDDNGRGRWYYRSGRLALDYYDAEETNAQQRFVIYSSGEPDERGRTHPITILATFDYLGNGIVFDHTGKIRLKYNQTEGVVLDRGIGPVSHWKWHTLNDPPVLQQVMIDTQMAHKDPNILKLGTHPDTKPRPANEEMLAIEFDNFIKEKSKKLSQKFKPFQIKMKALKINEHFSLRVLDQATVYLIFRDGSTNVKLNIGMILDHQEIVDTDTAEVGEVSNSLERFPARTDSLAALQRSVAYAQRYERHHAEREHRLRPPEPCASADQLTAAVSPPLRLPLRTAPTVSSSSVGYCKKLPTNNVYYDTRLL